MMLAGLIPAVTMFILFRRASKHYGASPRALGEQRGHGATPEDPLVTYAHGEIGDDGFAQRLFGLLRVEPNQTLTPRKL